MAQDFDFKRPSGGLRGSNLSAPQPTPVNITPAATVPGPQAPKKKGMLVPILLITFIYILIFCGIYYYFSQQKPTKIISGSGNAKVSGEKVISQSKTPVSITVYDRGLGASGTEAVVGLLSKNNLKASASLKPTVPYRKNFLFYNTQAKSEAEKINGLLAASNLFLKESPLPGISIYLATP